MSPSRPGWRQYDGFVSRGILSPSGVKYQFMKSARTIHQALSVGRFDGSATEVKLSWTPGLQAWGCLLGALGTAIARLCFEQTATLYLLISPDAIAKRTEIKWRGWKIIGLGMVAIFASIAIMIVAASLGATERIMNCLTVVTVASPCITICGDLYLFTCNKSLVWASQISREYVWIEGVAPMFLATLPHVD